MQLKLQPQGLQGMTLLAESCLLGVTGVLQAGRACLSQAHQDFLDTERIKFRLEVMDRGSQLKQMTLKWSPLLKL